MSLARKLVCPWLLVSILLSGASTAYAGRSSPSDHQTIHETVTWTMYPGAGPGQCKDIATVINGTGQRSQVINTRTAPDGSKHVENVDLVTSTASGANGEAFLFYYVNHSSQDVPPSGSPIQIKMDDLFVLNGKSGTDDLRVAFVWSWTYDPNTSAYWPPVDNWQKTFTTGDPLTCDPI